MKFDARWNAVSYDGGGLFLSGKKPGYDVTWGDGSSDSVTLGLGGDGLYEGNSPVHFYASDGTYDVSVSQTESGLPPEHLKAFMYSRAEGDIDIGGTNLSDIITGGVGNDTLDGSGGSDVVAGADGNDHLKGGGGDFDFLLGGMGDDVVSGGGGTDLAYGNEGNDVVHGGTGQDYVHGDAGNDKLFGDEGDDYLQGDAGADRLTGGDGADTFVFVPPTDANGNTLAHDPDRDTIVDFQQGIDHLSVENWFPNQAFTFIGGDKFTGAGDEIRFTNQGGGTIVFGDVDGDKIADFSFKIDATVTLTHSDFGF